ncbi:MAG: hypothetical protein Q8Q05_03450 [bacterium]|nr:hypothetical protein [bacterium]
MAEISSTLERFCQEQSFLLDHSEELRRSWPRAKWRVVSSFYLKYNGDRRDQPINDYGLFLRNLIPQELARKFWQQQLAELREKEPELTKKEALEKIENQIHSMLLSHYQAAPVEVRTRMEWLNADKREGIQESNALLPRKLSELKKMRAKGLRSIPDIQLAGTKGLKEIRGFAARTSTKILVAVGDPKTALKPKQFSFDLTT